MNPQEMDMLRRQAQGLSEAQKLALYESKKKNEWVGVILSFFVPGLGQIVMGEVGMGILMLVFYLVGWLLALILIGLLIAPVIWIWSMVDAYQRARRYNAMLYSVIFES